MQPRQFSIDDLRQLVDVKLQGKQVDPAGFVDALFDLTEGVGELRCSLSDNSGLSFNVDGRKMEVPLDSARGKLRMLCARLSVLLDDSKLGNGSPYGGEGVLFPNDPAKKRFVWYRNTPDEQEFVLTNTTLEIPLASRSFDEGGVGTRARVV